MPETDSLAGVIMSLDRQVHRKQRPLLCQAPFGRLMHGAEWKPWPNLCRSWNRKRMKTVMTCKVPRISNLVYLSPKNMQQEVLRNEICKIGNYMRLSCRYNKPHGPSHQPTFFFTFGVKKLFFFASNWITWQRTRCRWVSIVQSCIPFGEEARLVEPINSINLSCVTSWRMLLK